jgi:hypothetical protein
LAYDSSGATVGASGHDAATIVAALIGQGVLDADGYFEAYTELTTSIVNFLVALEQGVSAKPASAPRKSYGGNQASTSGPAGSIELRSGKYAGKTVDAVIAEDREYAEWFAESGKNEFMAKKFAEALAA